MKTNGLSCSHSCSTAKAFKASAAEPADAHSCHVVLVAVAAVVVVRALHRPKISSPARPEKGSARPVTLQKNTGPARPGPATVDKPKHNFAICMLNIINSPTREARVRCGDNVIDSLHLQGRRKRLVWLKNVDHRSVACERAGQLHGPYGVIHVLYNALEGEGWSAICYMRYIREWGCFSRCYITLCIRVRFLGRAFIKTLHSLEGLMIIDTLLNFL